MANRATAPARPDWKTVKGMIDMAAVATALLGPALGRRGERGRRLWWCCPFHEDRNPSLCIRPGERTWKCFGCGEHGDAATLVMKLNPGMTFPAAVSYLTGGPAPSGNAGTPRPRPPVDDRPRPSGMSEADTLALVDAAAARLWTPEGADALAYLHGRGLTDETIRAARLGVAPPLALPGRPRGIVIPWFHEDRLALVKLRQPEGVKPKYREVFRDPARLTIYPGPHVIQQGRPLIVVEGEMDALLLGQELIGLAPVVTLGSASARPTPGILGSMLAAAPWYVATDNDPAGDQAASGWPARARRVPPPGSFKDWTEARQGGVNLRRWWSDHLGGNEAPPMFSWNELAALCWGTAKGNPAPGIVIDRPDRGRMMVTLRGAADDPEERQAIQAENVCGLDNLSCDNEGDGGGVAATTPAPLIRP
jgi:hypothetical protein